MLIDTLEDLASVLSAASAQPTKTDEEVKAISVSPRAPEGYVWPRLRGWEGEVDASVVVIEAAGAVGKSAAALALAERVKWPLVDAAKAQVGSYSLTGLIQDAFGFDSPFLPEVSRGSTGVIVDALDEAHLKAGTTNFEAFLDNVRKLAGSGRISRRPNIILFSRPDTANLVRTYFTEHATSIATATIEFFTYRQACDYITSYLNVQDSVHHGSGRFYDVARKHPGPFAAMRDKRIREVASALTSSVVKEPSERWEELSSFLGYAPVLSVLAEYLAVANPQKEQGDNRSFRATPAKVLLEIIENILVREQKKFTDQVVPQLRAKLPANDDWDNFARMYAPEEQGIRLVARSGRLALATPFPVDIPSSIRAEYDSFTELQIADHPFLVEREAVNVVFADYIRAKAAVDVAVRVVLDREPISHVTSVGPFFYQFVHEFAPRIADDIAQLRENLVVWILDSYSQSFIPYGERMAFFFQQDTWARVILVETRGKEFRIILEFDVVELSGFLEIRDNLRRVYINTDAGVGFLGARDRFTIGPSVTVRCNELMIDVGSLSVDPIGEPSILAVKTIEVRKNLNIDSPKVGALRVVGRHPVSAFIPYLVDESEAGEVIDWYGFLTLRSLLRRFSQGLGPMPSVYADLLDQRVVKDNVHRKRFLARLCELGVIDRAPNHYYLNTTVLSHYGISLQDILSGSPTDGISKLITVLNRKGDQGRR
ncbi:hypothetical protein [Actinophytocola oryzae]|uniref:hypothetical protein n=1 Tax=Actinophytocola oryzae TaxID=502181 RepID=UPI001062781D|nr:hypothetical protein [Actinophytocola oryzae]